MICRGRWCLGGSEAVCVCVGWKVVRRRLRSASCVSRRHEMDSRLIREGDGRKMLAELCHKAESSGLVGLKCEVKTKLLRAR